MSPTLAGANAASTGSDGVASAASEPTTPAATAAPPTEVVWRNVYANDPARNEFIDNTVVTSQYTALNFVPKFLMEQFSRFVNLYFLFVCVLQTIPAITITNSVPTYSFSLGFVLLFDAIVTAREDYKRHLDDQAANTAVTQVIRDGTETSIPWQDVRVGDILKVYRGQEFPADLVFLAAGAQDDWQTALCHVQTAQLDGETNLKIRRAPDATVGSFRTDSDCVRFEGVVRCEEPTEHFGRFTALLYVGGDVGSPAATATSLSADNTLLRGCVLRNVDHIYGMVVYTGEQTKVRVKQSAGRPSKRGSIEQVVNRNLGFLVLFLLFNCLLGAIGNLVWTQKNWDRMLYLDLDRPDFVLFLEKVFTFFLLQASFIPISLYVTMKLARQMQKLFLEWDNQLVHVDKEVQKRTHGKGGTYPLSVRSMDLNDELGQITHIFSDKTGTLTSNIMEFRKLSVNGVSYGVGTTNIGLARRRRVGEDVAALEAATKQVESLEIAIPHVKFLDGSDDDPSVTFQADASDRSTPQGEAIHMFMLHLALNHTVLIETLRDEHHNIIGSALSSSSPDEEAFVYAAEFFEYKFLGRVKDQVTLSIYGEKHKFQIVAILEYTQKRKMMSVVVEDSNRRRFLFSKGADSKIFSKLAKSSPDAATLQAHKDVQTRTSAHLTEWGEDGLRTLCFAYRELQEEEFDGWYQQYTAALSNDEEKAKYDRGSLPNAVTDAMNAVERNLILQGATANEDRLQEGVPETIADLADAGIKIWMLTGDKSETAVNIGFATQMLTNDMEMLLFTVEALGDSSKVGGRLQRAAEKSRKRIESGDDSVSGKPLALVLDEHCIDAALSSPGSTQGLLEVAQQAKAVVCCRSRPDQKAAIVSLIRNNVPGARTLAIGDGANDVDMILTSHVGVGIVGAEGVQAANASDYSIGRFRFLRRLLLVHGRWNYNRMSKLIPYMFYKNITYAMAQYWFSILFAAWSGQKFFLEMANITVDVVYTGLPILLLAIFDQDVNATSAVRFPYLYIDGVRRTRLTSKIFWAWIASAYLDSALLFFVPMQATAFFDEDGATLHVFDLGSVTFTAYVVVVTLRVALETNLHDYRYQIILVLSVLLWVPASFVIDALDGDGIRGRIRFLWASPQLWFTVLLVASITGLYVGFHKVYRRYFRPEYRDLVQELQICIKDDHTRDRIATSLYEWPFMQAIRATLAERRADGAVPAVELARLQVSLLKARDQRRAELGKNLLYGADVETLREYLAEHDRTASGRTRQRHLSTTHDRDADLSRLRAVSDIHDHDDVKPGWSGVFSLVKGKWPFRSRVESVDDPMAGMPMDLESKAGEPAETKADADTPINRSTSSKHWRKFKLLIETAKRFTNKGSDFSVDEGGNAHVSKHMSTVGILQSIGEALNPLNWGLKRRDSSSSIISQVTATPRDSVHPNRRRPLTCVRLRIVPSTVVSTAPDADPDALGAELVATGAGAAAASGACAAFPPPDRGIGASGAMAPPVGWVSFQACNVWVTLPAGADMLGVAETVKERLGVPHWQAVLLVKDGVVLVRASQIRDGDEVQVFKPRPPPSPRMGLSAGATVRAMSPLAIDRGQSTPGSVVTTAAVALKLKLGNGVAAGSAGAPNGGGGVGLDAKPPEVVVRVEGVKPVTPPTPPDATSPAHVSVMELVAQVEANRMLQEGTMFPPRLPSIQEERKPGDGVQ